MTNEEKITKLTDMWYSCLIDHHKDKDCHFYINKTWSYGNKPIYNVSHYGYIHEEINEDFETMEEAEPYLISELIKMIKHEAELWLAIAKSKTEDWDYKIAVEYKERFERMLEELNEIR